MAVNLPSGEGGYAYTLKTTGDRNADLKTLADQSFGGDLDLARTAIEAGQVDLIGAPESTDSATSVSSASDSSSIFKDSFQNSTKNNEQEDATIYSNMQFIANYAMNLNGSDPDIGYISESLGITNAEAQNMFNIFAEEFENAKLNS